MPEKLNLLLLTGLIPLVLLIWKWIGSSWGKIIFFKMRWLTLLNWIVVLTLSIVLKQPPRKLEAWFVLWSFFFLKLICISITTIWSFMEYCCDVWAGARSCYLDCYISYEQLCYIYKLFYITIHPSLAAFFEVSSKCSHLKSFL